MGYLMPKPPPDPKKSKEENIKFSEEWDRSNKQYFKAMAIMLAVAWILFFVLAAMLILLK